MTLFESVFAGNDAVYGLTEGAINQAIEKYGADKAVSFPDTAYSLPCYYAVTGTKVGTLAELKDALAVVKTLMTREKRTNDVFMSGVATALCAEFIEVLKYIDGAVPYEAPCYGHLADAVIRELGVPLVTGDIPGVAVILGKAPSAQEAADLVKSYQSQGILITLVGDDIDQLDIARHYLKVMLAHSRIYVTQRLLDDIVHELERGRQAHTATLELGDGEQILDSGVEPLRVRANG